MLRVLVMSPAAATTIASSAPPSEEAATEVTKSAVGIRTGSFILALLVAAAVADVTARSRFPCGLAPANGAGGGVVLRFEGFFADDADVLLVATGLRLLDLPFLVQVEAALRSLSCSLEELAGTAIILCGVCAADTLPAEWK